MVPSMNAECTDFHFSCPFPGSHGKRRIHIDFSGGTLTSGGSVVLLGLADDRLALIPRLAGCFQDSPNPLFTVHSVEALVGQRLPALAPGREDLVDHDRLRHDPATGAVGLRATGGQKLAEPSGTVRGGWSGSASTGRAPASSCGSVPVSAGRLFLPGARAPASTT